MGGALFDGTRRVNIADLVMQAGRPVLIVPQNCTGLKLDHVMVGWKGSRESRRAVADALPLLKLARRVSVVEIAPEHDLPHVRKHIVDVAAWLERHGIAAQAEAFPLLGEDSEHLADLAHEKAADLVVAGAYGHSRVREWVLGGVTMDFLLNPDRCVLASH